MKEFLLSAPAQAVIWTIVLLLLAAAGGRVVSVFRGRAAEDRLSADDLLRNFRELHHQGDIDDAEFRTIKTALRAQFERELKETDHASQPGGSGFQVGPGHAGPTGRGGPAA